MHAYSVHMVLTSSPYQNAKETTLIENEISVMKMLKHPNCIRLFDVCIYSHNSGINMHAHHCVRISTRTPTYTHIQYNHPASSLDYHHDFDEIFLFYSRFVSVFLLKFGLCIVKSLCVLCRCMKRRRRCTWSSNSSRFVVVVVVVVVWDLVDKCQCLFARLDDDDDDDD